MPHEPPPLVTVCRRELTSAPENYYLAEYHGQTIYFCTSFCLDAFNADPERFYQAHNRERTPSRQPPAA